MNIKIALEIILLSAILYPIFLYMNCFLISTKAIKTGEAPEKVENFPVHSYSTSEYESIKKVLDNFIKEAKENKNSKIFINSSEINCLISERHAKRSYHPSFDYPPFYTIENNKIYQRQLSFPWPFSRFGYSDRIDEYSLPIQESYPLHFLWKVFSINDKKKRRAKIIKVGLIYFPLLKNMFSSALFNYDEKLNFTKLMGKITSLDIVNNKLIIEVSASLSEEN